MKETLMEIALRYTGNSKEANDMVDELMNVIHAKVFVVSTQAEEKGVQKYEREVMMRREQITDINQWTEILIKYRHKIRERVLWSMINDINNRTTD
jgi:cytochrome c biogenesis factor